MHVSTAFSFCPHLQVDEKFYPMPITYNEVIQQVKNLPVERLQAETKK